MPSDGTGRRLAVLKRRTIPDLRGPEYGFRTDREIHLAHPDDFFVRRERPVPGRTRRKIRAQIRPDIFKKDIQQPPPGGGGSLRNRDRMQPEHQPLSYSILRKRPGRKRQRQMADRHLHRRKPAHNGQGKALGKGFRRRCAFRAEIPHRHHAGDG